MDAKKLCPCLPKRYELAQLLALGLFIYQGINITRPHLSEIHGGSINPVGVYLRLYNYAFCISSILSGFLAFNYGGQKLLGIAIGGTSFFSFLLPASYESPAGLVVLNIIKGFLEGVIIPAFVTLWAFWAPTLENTTLVSIAWFGYSLGNALWPLILEKLSDQISRSAPVYICGLFGIIWTVIWFIVARERPTIDISLSSTQLAGTVEDGDDDTASISVVKMCTCKCVYAILIVALCISFNNMFTFEAAPHFQQFIYFTLDLDDHALLNCSMVGSAIECVVVLTVGFVSDFLRRNRHLSTTSVRKIFTVFGLTASAILSPIIGFEEDSPILIAILILIQGTLISGFLVNVLDIGPRFAGPIIGIALGIATLVIEGIVLTSASVTKLRYEEYNNVGLKKLLAIICELKNFQFLSIICTVMNLLGALGYWLMASGDKSNWTEATTTQPQHQDIEINIYHIEEEEDDDKDKDQFSHV